MGSPSSRVTRGSRLTVAHCPPVHRSVQLRKGSVGSSLAQQPEVRKPRAALQCWLTPNIHNIQTLIDFLHFKVRKTTPTWAPWDSSSVTGLLSFSGTDQRKRKQRN